MNYKNRNVVTAIFAITITSVLVGSSVNDVFASEDHMHMKDEMHMMENLKMQLPNAFTMITETEASELEMAGHKIIEHNLYARSVDLPVLGHTVDNPKTYKAMTFNEQVPGPTLRANQGDIIKMTLCIPDDEVTPHSIDQHASEMSATEFHTIFQGDCDTYIYVAHYAGMFKYHCEGIGLAAMDQHVLSGMYGLIIVDPHEGYRPLMVERMTVEDGEYEKKRNFYSPEALEFQLQFQQQYVNENGNYDANAMFTHHQSAHVINGIAYGYVPNETHNELIMGDPNKNIFVLQPWNGAELGQYQSQLMFAPAGKHVRLFVENQGNEPLYFHIVGEIFDRVVQANRVQAKGQDTHLIGGSQGAIVDLVFDKPGVYAAVNHDYAAIFQGAGALFVVGDYFGLNEQLGANVKSYAELLGNPSDSIPPYGKQSVEHPMINVHGLYTDERAEKIQEMIDDGTLLQAPFN